MNQPSSIELGDTIQLTATIVGIRINGEGKRRYELRLFGDTTNWDSVYVGEEVIAQCKNLTC